MSLPPQIRASAMLLLLNVGNYKVGLRSWSGLQQHNVHSVTFRENRSSRRQYFLHNCHYARSSELNTLINLTSAIHAIR
jgi:hypothetical protein